MPHSYNKIWIHAVWSTKDREKVITPKIESKIHNQLRTQLRELGCPVRIVNGMPDHIHCLFLLNPKKSISEVIKQLKGNSSNFINQNNLTDHQFSWQTGYASFSVSESVVEKVFNYIKNQKLHHAKKSFQQEENELLKLAGLKP